MTIRQKKAAKRALFGRIERLRLLNTGSAMAAAIALAGFAAATASAPAAAQEVSVTDTVFDTAVNGVNVRAQARFNGSQVNFSPGTLADAMAPDVVRLLQANAIINWTTVDPGNPGFGFTVDFLGSGNNLQFTSALADYTVLNRVFTPGFDSPINISGNIGSTVLNSSAIGGNVWFYSPGGMILGANANFNVGGLVLTTSQLDAIGPAGSAINFGGVTNPNSRIDIQGGAQITANNTNSYVAIVAPYITHDGNIRVNGSAALVAAEQAQLTINNGLFDIAVSVGSENSQGIVHTGTTGGPASQATVDGGGNITNADAHAIYLVAVPKNTAMTMLVSGTLGYDAATSAARTDNGTIILSAGANVMASGGASNPQITIDTDSPVAGGSIEVEAATFTSNTEIYASDTVDLVQNSPSIGDLGFSRLTTGGDGRGDYSLNVLAGEELNFGVRNFSTIDIAGDLTLRVGSDQNSGGTLNFIAQGPGPEFDDEPPRISGRIPPADAGQVSIGGNLTLDVSGKGRDDFGDFRNNGGTGIGEDSAGGAVNLTIDDNAALNIGGNLTLDASGQGGKGENRNGASTGGTVNLSVVSGALNVTGTLRLDASAKAAQEGKSGTGGSGLLGSAGTGGTVTATLSGGQVDAGTLFLDASARGSNSTDGSVTQNASAAGGRIQFDVTGGTHSFGDVNLSAVAQAGRVFPSSGEITSGTATRGAVGVALSGAGTLVQVSNNFEIFANTSGGVTDSGGVVAGVSATGTGPSGGLRITGDLTINATAANGSETALNTSGSIDILVEDSAISSGRLTLDTTASPSGSRFFLTGEGSDFQAGDITITAQTGGLFSSGSASITADATGDDFVGGNGSGGTIILLADNGTIDFTGELEASTAGLGGSGIDLSGNPGVGQGGNIRFAVQGAAGRMNLSDVFTNSDGLIFTDAEGFFGSGGPDGDGGRGIAGTVTFDLTGGIFAAGDVFVSADGEGGAGGSSTALPAGSARAAMAGPFAFSASSLMSGLPKAGRGGDGTGGTVTFNLNGTTATMASLDVSADGVAGSGGFGDIDLGINGGDGGNAFGGDATFNALSGSLTVTNTLGVSARGNSEFFGGNGGSGSGVAGGDGGNAQAGTAIFNLTGTASIVADAVEIDASAYGGEGGSSSAKFDASGMFVPGDVAGNGGTGTAGSAVFNNTSGSIDFLTLTVSANGNGGDGGNNSGFSTGDSNADGGNAGAGIGGTATINLNQDDGSDPTYVIQALGTGGRGGTGLDSGDGGFAQGGTARLYVNNVNVNADQITITSSATGGNGGFVDGPGGTGGTGGSAIGGSSILDVTGINGQFSSDNQSLITSDGQGGNGADGVGPTFSNAGLPSAGNGGAGGNGRAGEIQIIARNGAALSYFSDAGTTADGRGGSGGAGGSDFIGAVFGNGGAAGSATGGQIDILAQTGGIITLSAANLVTIFSASAFGGLGGNGGTSSSGDLGVLGANGVSLGGGVTVSADGAGSTIDLTNAVQLVARAQNPDDARTRSVGASATGGAAVLSGANGGAFTGGNDLTLNSSAATGSAFSGVGPATGGSARIELTGASAVFGAVDVNVGGVGGAGTQGLFSDGANGGDALGGSVDVAVDAASSFDLTSIAVDASATGGAGGLGDTSFGGGIGGTATGGDITANIAGQVANLTTITFDAGATGGTGGAGGIGGIGGAGAEAQGGTVAVNLIGTGPIIPSLFVTSVNARAQGGAGGAGGNGTSSAAGGTGGAGANATGGEASFAISGAGATFDFVPEEVMVRADATGGAGGNGGGNFVGGTAGDGGAGGAGNGGTASVLANSGTQITLVGSVSNPVVISSNGNGGAGGAGGGIDMVGGGIAGDGGNGGTGQGGSPVLRAIGGTISGTGLNMEATGFGGNGGAGGDDGTFQIGSRGSGGTGIGGTPLMEVLEGSPGILNFDVVTLLATGTGGTGITGGQAIGGLVTIRDLSPDPLGLISLGSLSVDASGISSIAGGGFAMSGGSGTTSVAGDVTVTVAGDIIYNFDGNGQLTAGGNISLDAGGNIIVTHTNNAAGVLSIDSAGQFDAQAAGNFTSTENAIINAGAQISINADGNIAVHDVRGVGFVQANAGQNAALNNATVSGPPSIFIGSNGTSIFSGLLLQAGLESGGSFSFFDPGFSARITGDVTSTGYVNVNAGGSVTFAAGANVVSDNGIRVLTGDDIIIETGARIEAGANPASAANIVNPLSDPNNLILAAGGLIDSGQLIGNGASPIASIIAAGSIAANDFAAVLTANAVDGLGGTIEAGSVAIDINNAPNAGLARSNDDGLLSPSCLQGAVCLGSISADNIIAIGQNSNNDVINLIVEQASVSANDILITIRDDIVMGTEGIPTDLVANNQFSITSLTGNVDLRDAAISSGQISISAAGSLLGTGSLASANDIGIDVGQDINLVFIGTGGQLTNISDIGGPPELEYTVPGSINVGQYDLGSSDVRIVANGDNSFGAINIGGTGNVTLVSALGDVFLGTTSGANAIDLSGNNAGFTNLSAAGALRIEARAGSIAGGSATAGGTADLLATGGIAGSSINAGGNITLQSTGSGTIAVNTLSAAGLVSAQTGGAFTATNVAAGGNVFINAAAGITAANLTAATARLIAANGAVRVAGNADVAGLVDVDARDIFLRAGDDLTVAADATFGNIDIATGRNLDIRGASAAGNIVLVSGGTTAINAAAAAMLRSPPAGFQSVQQITTTNGGNITITAAADILVNSAVSAAGNLTMDAAGLINLQAAASGINIATRSADMNIGTAGTLGRADVTRDIVIRTNGNMLLGGVAPATPANGFTLYNDEFSRIHSGDDLTFVANINPASGAGSITVQELDVLVAAGTGTPTDGNIGSLGGLFLDASDSVFINGDLTVSRAGANSFVGIDAVNGAAINTASGNLRIENAAGNITGQLGITARTISAISAAAGSAIAGASTANIDVRLGQVDAARPNGYIQAGTVTLNADSSVLIQNSGTGTDFDQRRGITANTLSINTLSPSAAIVINGVIGGNAGVSAIGVTGVPNLFDPASTINGCVIINPASCTAATPVPPMQPPPTRPNPGNDPLQDLIDSQIDPSSSLPGSFTSILVEYRENPETRRDPLIDEPVTGAGNDDMWLSEDECEGSEKECADEVALEPAE